MANELGSDSNTVWSSGNASLSMPPPTAVPISATRSDSNIEKAEANSETGNPTTTVTKMQEDEYYEEYEEDYEEEEKHIPPSLNMIGDQSLSSTISALSGELKSIWLIYQPYLYLFTNEIFISCSFTP